MYKTNLGDKNFIGVKMTSEVILVSLFLTLSVKIICAINVEKINANHKYSLYRTNSL